MDIWIIFNKLIVLLYYIYNFIYLQISNSGSYILSILIYMAINISIYIVKDKNKKIFLILASILLIIITYNHLNIYVVTLLPINIYELMLIKFNDEKKGILLSLFTSIFISKEIVEVYILISLLSYLFFISTYRYYDKLSKLEQMLDSIRKDKYRLSQEINKKQEYIKQTEYTVKLEERNKLSQQIHDSIGHSITGALIQMEASKAMIDIDKEQSKKLLQNSINITKNGIEEIRIYLKKIKPPKETLGINKLKLLADEFAANNNISVLVTYSGDIENISYIQWRVIQDICIESMTNSSKYSSSSKLSVSIEVLNKLIKVNIKDDGVGCKLIKKGLGIMGMEEKSSNINAKLIVDGSIGFSVTLLIPIENT